MTSYSKYFNIAMENATCDIIHCGDTCLEMFRWNFMHMLFACLKYFGPVSMLQIIVTYEYPSEKSEHTSNEKYSKFSTSKISILMKIRQVNVDIVKQCGENFIEYSLATWITSVPATSLICLYYNLFGRFHHWSLLGLPAATGASICSIVCSNRLLRVFSRGLSTMATETVIKLYADNNSLLRILRDSKLALTLAFMCANAALICGLQQVQSDVFWFIQPFKRTMNFVPFEKVPSPLIDRIVLADKHYCQHKNSCDSFLKQEVLNYLKFGIGIEIVRMILGNWKEIIQKPMQAFNLIRKINYNFIGFLVGYTSIYRISTCLLTRLCKTDSLKNQLISALLCGTSFYLYPKISLFCHAFITAVELSWKTYNRSTNEDDKIAIISFLNKMPLSRIIYPLVFGYLCYLRPFYPWATPKFVMDLLKVATISRDTVLMKEYYTRLYGYSQSEVLYLFGRQ